MAVKLANFARSVLALGITADDLLVSVADAATFPAFGDGDYTYAVMENALYQREIVKITARAGNTFTIVRGQDGTSARAFNAGDIFALRVTSTVLDAWITAATAVMDAKITALENTVSELALLPAGSLVDWPTDVIPGDFLLRNGAALSRATYVDLFSAIGTRYGVGDGATTFNIPDHLGEFPRYWAASSGRDPDIYSRTAAPGSSATLPGSKQGSMYASHSHTTNIAHSGLSTGGAWCLAPTGSGPYGYASTSVGGNETRPRNVYVTPLIKWR
jgi:hypothetical protein